MDRVTYLSELYGKSVTELTKNRKNWKGLLSGMARYYKYSFDNNVLIYTQRPNASQLATMDVWNKIGRRVNKGGRSIAVIDLSNPKASLKYLFDLMDTNGSHDSLRRVMGYMWELEEQYRPGILLKFHDKYDTDTASIESCIYDLAEKRVNEILPQYLQDFSITDEGSMLYGLPIEAVKEQFAELVRDSVGYMVFRKCGLSTDQYEESSFENISHFNSMGLFMRMGSITMSIARPILREINQEIENIKYERSTQNEYESIDRPDLQRGRGRDVVPQPPSVGGRTARPEVSGQIREAVERVHDGTAPAPGIGTDSGGQAEPDDNGSGRGSREPQRIADTGAFESAAHAENGGYAGEGGPHADDNHDSGRNYNERSGIESEVIQTASQTNPPESVEPLSGGFLRLEDDNEDSSDIGEDAHLSDSDYGEDVIGDYNIPDEIHEMQGVRDEDTESPAIPVLAGTPSVTRDQIIERVLLQGNITHGGKESIQNATLSMQSKQDRVSFIRNEYGYTGVGMGLDGGGHYRWSADGKGIVIDYKDGNLEFIETLSWSRAETLISDLVRRGAYLLPGDSREQPAYEPAISPDADNLQLEPYTAIEQEEEPVMAAEPHAEQLTLFGSFAAPQDVYEITDGRDSDGIITESAAEHGGMMTEEAEPIKDTDMQDLFNHDDTFRYQLLDRLRLDCKYYLGHGNRNAKNLWAGNEEKQIEAMKTLWHSFTEENKPEWIT